MNNEKKIPKIIHYCWFGKTKKSEKIEKYIESWRKYCPDYKIIEWNETNFDINSNIYIKEAYSSKKWAFVSDYVRLWALVNYGGIYMDTDVELLRNLDQFLDHSAFSGFENESSLQTAIMGCEKNFNLFKEFLKYYENRHFILENGEYDLTTNVETITKICEKYGLQKNNTYQNICGLIVYPNDYFCPKDYNTNEIAVTENSIIIHHFSGSWYSEYDKKLLKVQQKCIRKFGKQKGLRIYCILTLPYRVCHNIKNNGIKKTFLHLKKKYIIN